MKTTRRKARLKIEKKGVKVIRIKGRFLQEEISERICLPLEPFELPTTPPPGERISACGKYAGVGSSSEVFMRRRSEENRHEELRKH